MVRKTVLDPHLISLMFEEPFFAGISRRISKRETKRLSTAGVTVKDAELLMYFNPDFIASLEDKKVRGLLKHEIYHIVLEHLGGRRKEPHKRWNLATDLAINSLIPLDELPECGIVPGERTGFQAPEEFLAWVETLPKEKSSEWYFEKLQNEAPDDGGGCNGECDGNCQPGDGSGGDGEAGICTCPPRGFDDHSGWDDIPEDERELVKGKIKEAVREAVKEADRSNQWGSVSSSMRETLRRMISNQIDWRILLKNFVGMSLSSEKTTSRKRRNRKYRFMHPGTKRKRHARMAIAIDMSGSVSNDELELLFAELNNMAKRTTFTVIPFDHTVDEENIFEWRRGQSVPPRRFRSGGTDFDAPTRWINERKAMFDGLLILTDGECSQPQPCRIRRGWVITPGRSLYFSTPEIVINMSHAEQQEVA